MSFKIMCDLSARACTKEQNTSLWAVFLPLEIKSSSCLLFLFHRKLLRDKVKECKFLGFLYRWHSCLSLRPSVGISYPSFHKVILESAVSLKLDGGEGGDHGIWREEAIWRKIPTSKPPCMFLYGHSLHAASLNCTMVFWYLFLTDFRLCLCR